MTGRVSEHFEPQQDSSSSTDRDVARVSRSQNWPWDLDRRRAGPPDLGDRRWWAIAPALYTRCSACRLLKCERGWHRQPQVPSAPVTGEVLARSRGWHRRHHLVRGRLVRGRPDPLPAAGGLEVVEVDRPNRQFAPGDATLAPCVASVPPTAA